MDADELLFSARRAVQAINTGNEPSPADADSLRAVYAISEGVSLTRKSVIAHLLGRAPQPGPQETT